MTGNNDHDIDELLAAVHEAELKYRKECVELEHYKETLHMEPDLQRKLEFVELECNYYHLKRQFTVELERMKKREE